MADQIQLDVLAIFSHPDDAELTMAGTLLKLKSLGYRRGIADYDARRDGHDAGTPEIRAKEALDAARVMNLDARVNVGLPDGHLALNEESKLAVVPRLKKASSESRLHGALGRSPPDHAATRTLCGMRRDWRRMRRYDKDRSFEAIKNAGRSPTRFTRAS
jgi:LmbE family N-acetylglucosaminyl deacetylase